MRQILCPFLLSCAGSAPATCDFDHPALNLERLNKKIIFNSTHLFVALLNITLCVNFKFCENELDDLRDTWIHSTAIEHLIPVVFYWMSSLFKWTVLIWSKWQREVSKGGTAPGGDQHGSGLFGAPGDGCPPQHIILHCSPSSQWDIPKNSPEAPAVIERGGFTKQYIQSPSDLFPHSQWLGCKQCSTQGESLWCCFPDSNMALIRNDCTPPTHLSFLSDGYPGSQIQRLASSTVSSGPS